jgi:hypothetical protein
MVEIAKKQQKIKMKKFYLPLIFLVLRVNNVLFRRDIYWFCRDI